MSTETTTVTIGEATTVSVTADTGPRGAAGEVSDAELTAAVAAGIDALVAGAPGALDTLNELAAALGDDADFAGTVTAALALKADSTDLDAYVTQATFDTQGPSGRELDYAQSTAQQQTNNVKADVTDCVITFTVADRPVHVTACATVSNAVAGQNVTIEIANASNVVADGADALHNSSAAHESDTAIAHERITTPGEYTRKLRFQSSSATAGSAYVNIGGFGKAWIQAIEH